MSRAMKASGVEWIGEIPEGWHTIKLRNCLRRPITDGPHETPLYVTDGVPFISVNAINWDGTINRDVSTKITLADAKSYNVKANLEVGDILFTKAATIGKTAIVDKVDFMIWSPIAVIKVNEALNNRFLRYIFQCSGYINQVVNLGTRNTQINVGMRAMEQAKIPVCSPATQIQIANFLDEKTAQIDAIIEDTKKSLLEFKKYKQALITQAVTKGLNPDVNMKDSGIEWIGEIPEHWEPIKLKYVLSERSIKSKTGEEEPLSMSQKYGLIKTRDMDLIPNMTNSYVGNKIVKQNDLVFNKLKAHLGVFSVSNYEGIVSPDYAVYYPKKEVNVKFLEYVFKTTNCITEFKKRSRGIAAGLTRLYTNDLFAIKCGIPSLKEQNEIVDYINQKSFHIDSLIADKEKLITELETYKKALIFEYVTGKKEVE